MNFSINIFTIEEVKWVFRTYFEQKMWTVVGRFSFFLKYPSTTVILLPSLIHNTTTKMVQNSDRVCILRHFKHSRQLRIAQELLSALCYTWYTKNLKRLKNMEWFFTLFKAGLISSCEIRQLLLQVQIVSVLFENQVARKNRVQISRKTWFSITSSYRCSCDYEIIACRIRTCWTFSISSIFKFVLRNCTNLTIRNWINKP